MSSNFRMANPSDETWSEPPESIDLIRSLLRSANDPKSTVRSASVTPNRKWEAGNAGKIHGKILARHPSLTGDQFSGIQKIRSIRVSRSVTRGRQGYFHSTKNDRTLHFRSRLEFCFMRLNEVNPEVEAFVEQPIDIQYEDAKGYRRRHTPDLYVKMKDCQIFFEVKYEKQASTELNEERWPRIGQALGALGFRYEVVTEAFILNEPRNTNVRTLFRARRKVVEKLALIETLNGLPPEGTSISSLISRGIVGHLDAVYWMILNGYLSVDLALPIDGQTFVKRGDNLAFLGEN